MKYAYIAICLIAIVTTGCDIKPAASKEKAQDYTKDFAEKPNSGQNRASARNQYTFAQFVKADKNDQKRHPLLTEQLTLFAEMGKKGQEYWVNLCGSETASGPHRNQLIENGVMSVIPVEPPLKYHCKWCKQASSGEGFLHPPQK